MVMAPSDAPKHEISVVIFAESILGTGMDETTIGVGKFTLHGFESVTVKLYEPFCNPDIIFVPIFKEPVPGVGPEIE